MHVVADQQGRELIEVAKEAGGELVCATSLKAALDRDWDQQRECEEALDLVLQALRAVEAWVQTLPQEEADLAQPLLSVAQQIKAQDVETNEDGKASLIKGVAKDRRISVEDAEMRHGRKSRRVRVDGYKRHVLQDRSLFSIEHVMGLIDKKHTHSMLLHCGISSISQVWIIIGLRGAAREAASLRRGSFGVNIAFAHSWNRISE
jgi:hypothetical protein